MSRARVCALVVTTAIVGCGVERDLGSHDADAGTAPATRPGDCLPCQASEVCHRGTCIPRSRGGEACSDVDATRLGREDGCAPDAVCTAEKADAGARCVVYPPCAADDTCPVGAVGSACNRGFVATKANICLPGQCSVEANCPSTQRCLKTIGDLGLCSSGDRGSPCVVRADCKDASCLTPGGGYGICF